MLYYSSSQRMGIFAGTQPARHAAAKVLPCQVTGSQILSAPYRPSSHCLPTVCEMHQGAQWQAFLQASRTGDAQAQVLNCADLLARVVLPTPSKSCPGCQQTAAALFAVSKKWRTALQALEDVWSVLEWAEATKGAQRSDSALPSLCLSIQRWWGSKLQELDAGSGCPVARELLTDSHLALIARFSPRLQVVRLYGCIHITDLGLKQLAAQRPPLHTFTLEWCGRGVYLDGLRALMRSCPALEVFSISSGQEAYSLSSVTDELVLECVFHCPHIVALELSDTQVGDTGLAAIAAAYGAQLQSLQLNYTRAWGQCGVLALAQHCRALQFFSAASTRITDDALSLLGGGCPHLAFVCVDRCRQVTLDGIMRLVNRGAALRYVEMAGVFAQSSAEQRAAFAGWVQRLGWQYDARSGLIQARQAAADEESAQ